MRFTSKLSLLTLCSVALHNLMVINHEGIRRRVPILHSSAGLRMGRRNFVAIMKGVVVIMRRSLAALSMSKV